MASNNETERIEHQSDRSDVKNDRQDSSIDESSTKNLEYFPYKVLMEIFAGVDDIGLLNLASISYRFDGFAQIVFKKRYANKYFVIDNESEEQQEIYCEQFSRFGRNIKAIEANNIHNIDGNHWMARMLVEHTNDMKKLAFNGCTFANSTEIFAQHLNLTHLTLQRNLYGSDDRFEFPNYRNLKALEMCNFSNIQLRTLQQIASNNQQLESLNIRYCENLTLSEIVKLIVNHQLNHLKYLAVLDPHDFDNFPPPECPIERLVNSLEHLESLALFVDNKLNGLLRCLGTRCKMIKQLEICHLGFNMERETIAAISTFQNVENLQVTQSTCDDEFENFLGNLPNLRALTIDMFKPNTNALILSLRKCPLLEQFTLIFDYDRDEFPPYVNAAFYNEFLNVFGNRPIRIEFKEYGETVCYVTNTEIVWRNKLVHWIGFDPIRSQSSVQLLDLAKPHQQNPFDLIMDYLDLGSLYALYLTNKQCHQLVDAFVKKHSENEQKFVCTDEFQRDSSVILCPFRLHVNNLEVKLIYYRNIETLGCDIERSYPNLKELYFRSNLETCPQEFIVPQIRKFVFNSLGFRNFCDLNEILRICRDLETIEFVNEVEFGDDENDAGPICNLKKFIFKPIDENQMAFIARYFRNTQIELISTSLNVRA